MKKNLILIVVVMLSCSTFAQKDKRLKGIDKELNTILKETKAAGFAVAVVEKDQIIYSDGFGYSDIENGLKADANTLFAIGSSSKAFTSAVLGQLRDEDALSFDDSPREHIPELKFFNDQMDNSITIKDMMCHRTGLPRHDYSWYLFPTFNRDSLMMRIEHHEPFSEVREQWYYNNFMFMCQGIIAERITAKTWEDNIRERFFKPLDMVRSNVSIKELEKSENAAIGYNLKNDSINVKQDYYQIGGMAPAGSINSSVNEMSNWLMAWINDGKFHGEQILPGSYLREAISSQMVMSGALPDDEFPDMHMSTYGYGWMMSSYKGHYRVEHGGNIDGFSANVAFFPSDSIGIVVLTNQNGSAVPALVRNTIADRMLKTERTNWAERFAEKKAERKKNAAEDDMESNRIDGTSPSHTLDDYAKSFENPGYGKFTIVNENDSLFAQFERMKFYLDHYHYDIFQAYVVEDGTIDMSDREGLKLNFRTNEMGEISSVEMKIEPTLDPMEFKRAVKAIDIDDETLNVYVGGWDVMGASIKTYIKAGSLYMFVAGQPEYEMIATDKHKFSFKAIDGYRLEFIESSDGSVTEMKVIQPNGTFVAKRK